MWACPLLRVFFLKGKPTRNKRRRRATHVALEDCPPPPPQLLRLQETLQEVLWAATLRSANGSPCGSVFKGNQEESRNLCGSQAAWITSWFIHTSIAPEVLFTEASLLSEFGFGAQNPAQLSATCNAHVTHVRYALRPGPSDWPAALPLIQRLAFFGPHGPGSKSKARTPSEHHNSH